MNITPNKNGVLPKRKTFWELCKEQPLVPIGMLATVGILFGGLYSMAVADRNRSQKFMRARVTAQALTVAIASYYVYRDMLRKNPKELP
jgi:hypothetical protein